MNNKSEELGEIVKPLIKFLKENYDPMTVMVIDFNHVDIFSRKIGFPVDAKK